MDTVADKAFYLPDGDAFVSTASTRGPWDVQTQHGGPPSALMARAVDALLGDERSMWVPARTTIELRTRDAWPSARFTSWSRMRIPLVPGETPDGWQRALVFADAAHGDEAPGRPPQAPERHAISGETPDRGRRED